MKQNFLSLLIASLMAALPAHGQTVGCLARTDDKSLAACHAQQRRSYGTELERTLQRNGHSANVFVEEAGDPGSGAYPRLIIWILLGTDTAYRLNDEADILAAARRVGFRTLVYVDKGEDSNWYFNLTKPGKAALDVVPWQETWWTRQKQH